METLCCFSVILIVVFGSMILGHPQRFLRVFGLIGFVLCAYPAAVAILDLRATNLGHTESFDSATVRENPASYRPVSIIYVGYRPYTSASSSGGYSGGK